MPPYFDGRTTPSGSLLHSSQHLGFRLWLWARGPGRDMATALAVTSLNRIYRNLAPRRLFSFPHLLVLFWAVILLWGERWVFDTKVADCAWKNWEDWPRDAKPHHLVFVADPQIIDPHSYPGRPWPLSSLTVTITDNYLRRGYGALLKQLQPDSLFFLGDLFDGGREWKTSRGTFVDPMLGKPRSGLEQKWVRTWQRRYGDDYWLREYKRFGNIFFDPWNAAGDAPGAFQRGRKLVASLPGNHDLGFGAQIQVPVRERFSAFFGDVNRVDVVGNHTIVSVDTVSLSADTSEFKDSYDLRPIYGPVNEFLDGVKAAKQRAVRQELGTWFGDKGDLLFDHDVEELEGANLDKFPRPDAGQGSTGFPTILLTHVPLYREPGKPCGPYREHWPPAKPPKGQSSPVIPDHRNAISVSAGYQYQNVLNEEDSVKLVKSVGNVVHVFSGDDHDYCEVIHSDAKENVKEITVKSLSMAMGVPTPGFVMVSLYNPVDEHGDSITGKATMQTHLCLLPNQIHTYMKYVTFIFVSLVLLGIRAALVAVLDLTPFAFGREQGTIALPLFKDKAEPPDSSMRNGFTSSSGVTSHSLPQRHSTTSSRARNGSVSNGVSQKWQSKRKRAGPRYGYNKEDDGWSGPRISLDEDYYRGSTTSRRRGGKRVLSAAAWEMWTMTWRVAWMTLLFFAYLTRKG